MIQKFSSQRRHRQIVGKSMWVDRFDIRCCIGRATQRLGRHCDMANVIAVLRYMIGQRVQSHVDSVGVTCDTCKRAPNQRSAHSCGW